MDEADRMADRVAIIDQGRLLIVDTPEALKRAVGEGDVLEIDLDGGSLEEALAALKAVIPQVSATNHTLVVRARGVVEQLPFILDVLHGAKLHPGEVRLRANTLEDVFISLTGRRLRE
jgi:ABC-2 type transport system ATP-binding protein